MGEFPGDLTPPPREKTSVIQEGQWRDELWRYIQAAAALLGGGSLGQFLQSAGPGVAPAWTTGYPFIGLQVFSATADYDKTANAARLIIAFLHGGGGGGAGAPTTAAGQASCGSGGGGGSWAIKAFLTASLSDLTTFTIGAGGTSSAGGNGTTGGDTTFDSVTAEGGGGGSIGTAVAGTRAVNGGTGGTAAGGDMNFNGMRGDIGWSIVSPALQLGGKGADSILGGGGASGISTSGRIAGSAASGFGAGGGGGSNGVGGNAAIAGGSGSPGFGAIFEFA